LRLPRETAVAFVTGSTTAHTAALLAARRAVYEKAGWDVERRGLVGAAPITVVATDDLHASVLKALGIIGLGRVFDYWCCAAAAGDRFVALIRSLITQGQRVIP